MISALLLSLAGLLPAQEVPQAPSLDATGLDVELTASWAIQADGRIKPLQTFADETMASIAGRSKVGDIGPLELLWGAHFDWERFATLPLIKVNSSPFRAHLGLEDGERRVSYERLLAIDGFRELVSEGIRKSSAEMELEELERDALDVYGRLERLSSLAEGSEFKIVAMSMGGQMRWLPPSAVAGLDTEDSRAVFEGFGELAAAYSAHDAEGFSAAANNLTGLLREAGGDVYPSVKDLDRELFYNGLNAFGRAWKAYLLGFFLLAFLGRGGTSPWHWAGMAAIAVGFIGHTAGLILRWQIAGRAPVSDMYESLIFMGWGIILFGLIFEFVYRKGFFGIASGAMGFVALMFAENLPLDSAINPLVPVLANTQWLTIHVMTIMLSYSAFTVAMSMGHVMLFLQMFRPGKTKGLRTMARLLYKTMQVGVLFLAAGIAFGAIWANESWGRYWGWDPKETWSLITFFFYMVIIHARFAGWLNNFAMAVSSIVSFLAVLMTYYGVNFILGAGLHSYGFAEGGMLWLYAYLVVEFAFVAIAMYRYRSALPDSAMRAS